MMMDMCDPSPAGPEEPWRNQKGFLVFPRCHSQPQLSTGCSKDGHKHPRCSPSSELGSGLLLRGCDGHWDPPGLHRRFLGVQGLKTCKIHREQSPGSAWQGSFGLTLAGSTASTCCSFLQHPNPKPPRSQRAVPVLFENKGQNRCC